MEKQTLEQRIERVLPNLTPSERHKLDSGATWNERNGQLGLLAKCGWWTPVEILNLQPSPLGLGVDWVKHINKLRKKDPWLQECINKVFGNEPRTT